VEGSLALQNGAPPPPASSPNTTIWLSQVKAALCQICTLALWSRAVVRGRSRSERSHIWPSLKQAAAAILGSRKTVMSWQPRKPGAPKSFSSKVG
jgi:hypothetical protein